MVLEERETVVLGKCGINRVLELRLIEPHAAHPRHLRATCDHARRQAAGGAGAAQVPAAAARAAGRGLAVAARRRHRRTGPGLDAARGRPPAYPRSGDPGRTRAEEAGREAWATAGAMRWRAATAASRCPRSIRPACARCWRGPKGCSGRAAREFRIAGPDVRIGDSIAPRYTRQRRDDGVERRDKRADCRVCRTARSLTGRARLRHTPIVQRWERKAAPSFSRAPSTC